MNEYLDFDNSSMQYFKRNNHQSLGKALKGKVYLTKYSKKFLENVASIN